LGRVVVVVVVEWWVECCYLLCAHSLLPPFDRDADGVDIFAGITKAKSLKLAWWTPSRASSATLSRPRLACRPKKMPILSHLRGSCTCSGVFPIPSCVRRAHYEVPGAFVEMGRLWKKFAHAENDEKAPVELA